MIQPLLQTVIWLILGTSFLIPFTGMAGSIHPSCIEDDAFKKAIAARFYKLQQRNPSALSRPHWLVKSNTLENFDFWSQNPYSQFCNQNSSAAKRAASPSAFYFRDSISWRSSVATPRSSFPYPLQGEPWLQNLGVRRIRR